jgi:hypothetical protein
MLAILATAALCIALFFAAEQVESLLVQITVVPEGLAPLAPGDPADPDSVRGAAQPEPGAEGERDAR